jgi:hypothetical protein
MELKAKMQDEYIGKLGRSLEEYKEYNREIYGKYMEEAKRVVKLEAEQKDKEVRIEELERTNKNNNEEIGELTKQL